QLLKKDGILRSNSSNANFCLELAHTKGHGDAYFQLGKHLLDSCIIKHKISDTYRNALHLLKTAYCERNHDEAGKLLNKHEPTFMISLNSPSSSATALNIKHGDDSES